MKTAIIHVGGHKTGSTTVQTSLGKSKDRLLAEGIRSFNGYDRSVQLLSMGFRKFDRKGPLLKGNYATIQDVRQASYAAWIDLHRRVRREHQPFT